MSMKSYRGHRGDVFGVAIYQDKLISAGYDRIIRVFDINTMTLINKFAGHIDLIRSIDIYKDPKRPLVISGSWDRTIRVWDLGTGECIHILTGHTNRLKCVLVCELTSPGIVLSGSDDTTMRAWDMVSGHQIAEYDGHSHCVLSIAASAEADPLAASGSTDTMICIWNLLSGKHVFNLKGHESGVCALVFARPSTDGSRPALISSSSDSTIRIWSMDSGAQLHVLKGHEFGIVALSMWQDKTVPYPYLMTCAQNGTLQIWDLHSLELKKTTKTKTSYLICIAQQSGMDNMMAFGGAEGFLRVQRTEEIYNAADVIGSPAPSPTRRSQKSKSTKRIASKRINMSRSDSVESGPGGSGCFSFNDEDHDSISRGDSFEEPKSEFLSFQEMSTTDTFDNSPKKQNGFKAVKDLPKITSDSLPATPQDAEAGFFRGTSCDSVEDLTEHMQPKSPATDNMDEDDDEELSVCSFDARVVKSVIKEASNKSIPPAAIGSIREVENEGRSSSSLLGRESGDLDIDGMDIDDAASVLTDIDTETDNIFQNSETTASRSGKRFPKPQSTSSTGRLGSNSEKQQHSIMSQRSSNSSKAPDVIIDNSIPRIPSANWKHKGKHAPAKPISKGLGVGSRRSELTAKVHNNVQKRGLPRIIQPARPFILVTSLENQTYTPAPRPVPSRVNSSRQQSCVQIRYQKPPTMVSPPSDSLPELPRNCHNGYHTYNSVESCETIPPDVDGGSSLDSDFLDVSVKPPSPVPRKRQERSRTRKLK